MSNIVLALSGGGFRAALFHLGTVAYLKETRRLDAVTHLVGVSGGAIVAAYLASRWDEIASAPDDDFIDLVKPLIELTEKDVRGKILRRTLTLRSQRIKAYRRELASLFGPYRLSELCPQPELGILATNLSTGLPVAFSQGGYLEHSATPCWHPTDSISTTLAVAASSAFPALFPPVTVNSKDLGLPAATLTPDPHHLSDGGVIDNLGLWYVDYLRRHDDTLKAFVSDASGGFEITTRESFSGPLALVKTMARTTDIMMKALATDTKALSSAKRTRYISIEKTDIPADAHPMGLLKRAQNSISLVRTDLDAFTPIEANALFAHGFAIAADAIAEAPPRGTPGELELPYARTGEQENSQHVEQVLERAAKRRYVGPLFAFRRDFGGALAVLAFLALVASPFVFAVYYHKDLVGFRSHPFQFSLEYPSDLSERYASCFPDFNRLTLDQCRRIVDDEAELEKEAAKLLRKVRSATPDADAEAFDLGDATKAMLFFCGFRDAEETREGSGTSYALLTRSTQGFWARAWGTARTLVSAASASSNRLAEDLKGFILFEFNQDLREYNFAFTGQRTPSGLTLTIAQPGFSGDGAAGSGDQKLKARPAGVWSAEFDDLHVERVDDLVEHVDDGRRLEGKAWYRLDTRLPLVKGAEMPDTCRKSPGDEEQEPGVIQFATISLTRD